MATQAKASSSCLWALGHRWLCIQGQDTMMQGCAAVDGYEVLISNPLSTKVPWKSSLAIKEEVSWLQGSYDSK